MGLEGKIGFEVLEILKSKTKFQIYSYLSMYGQLSLTELAQKLKKSKSTIHEHLKPIIKKGLIETNKKPVESDSMIKSKVFENIYSLKKNVEEDLDIGYLLGSDKSFEEKAKILVEGILLMTKINITNLNIQAEFYQKLMDNFDENLDTVHLLLDGVLEGNEGLISSYIPLSIRKFKLFSEKFNEICSVIYSEEFKDIEIEKKPIIFMASAMPMKLYFEFLNKIKK